ncbi:hypothetical protein RT723_07755 [Psychrosphaera aquimarina]|uniref:Uncharacterized protein n=1 Tax=Psychrosphaera aquimarina TaxID=2044854 RepID=A0ABU3QZQ1_9GAMM|nr:hypothetical protein [Psychrosphaera aquimarina]MDU0112894.1 hypothetical protein [Psychrosphaera aquimarina]
MRLSQKYLIPFISITSLSALAADPVPNVFTAGTPAKAAEVNANFQHLVTATTVNEEALAALDAKIAEMEDSEVPLSPLSQLKDGEIELAVDCTNNPSDLLEKYQANAYFTNVNFSITGECYGDIRFIKGNPDDDEDNDRRIQLASQSVHLYAADAEQRASIIPNPDTQQVRLDNGLGGGLYISNLDIKAGTNDIFNAIGFYRGGHGSVNNTVITGVGSSDNTYIAAIVAQEGAQVYINGVTANEFDTGVFARNNATIRFTGAPSTFNVGGPWALDLNGATTVNQQADLTLNSTDGNALKIGKGVSWEAWEWQDHTPKITTQGNVSLEGGGFLQAGDMEIAGYFYMDQSVSRVFGDMTFSDVSSMTVTNNSSATFNNLVTEHLHIDQGAQVLVKGGTVSEAFANYNSSLKVESTTLNLISGYAASTVWMSSSTLTSSSEDSSQIKHNSTLTVENSTISNTVEIHSSKSEVSGDTFVGNTSSFNCSGMSSLEISVNDVSNNSNCGTPTIWQEILDAHLNR